MRTNQPDSTTDGHPPSTDLVQPASAVPVPIPDGGNGPIGDTSSVPAALETSSSSGFPGHGDFSLSFLEDPAIPALGYPTTYQTITAPPDAYRQAPDPHVADNGIASVIDGSCAGAVFDISEPSIAHQPQDVQLPHGLDMNFATSDLAGFDPIGFSFDPAIFSFGSPEENPVALLPAEDSSIRHGIGNSGPPSPPLLCGFDDVGSSPNGEGLAQYSGDNSVTDSSLAGRDSHSPSWSAARFNTSSRVDAIVLKHASPSQEE
ncbi:uncharacterized protein THITE_154507 [Thermothielavioides terrestris NRRL 8126]|uniref:Uncharacterized protein n=1 Tax=Thermothielavioides terrestris (strain ATCC 38088 / NRRL 8126) TaxID=578455 RepID=G2QVP0_THETT|nr:uncharacterized protein THITE_154507 [Thermothielavioides terrestris NRRL 8126]AEO63021.1 hypothetical protein THITE_154507 [Thermothielavioides terrestris NRRL 8126]